MDRAWCLPLLAALLQLHGARGASLPMLAWSGEGPSMPFGRADGNAAAATLTDAVLYFGGKDSDGNIAGTTVLMNTTTQMWETVTGSGSQPQARFSALLVAVRDEAGTYEQFVLVQGEGDGKVWFDDAWAFCVLGCQSRHYMQWRQLEPSGDRPLGRYGLTGGSYVDSAGRGVVLFTHGFRGAPDAGRFDDSFALTFTDMDTAQWTDVSPPEETRPFPRCLHGGALVADSVRARLVFSGGCGTGGHGPCPDPAGGWIFQRAKDAEPSDPGVWARVPEGIRPKLVFDMTAVVDMSGAALPFVLAYGGTGGPIIGADEANAVSVLDVDTGKWRLLLPSGSAPSDNIVKAQVVTLTTGAFASSSNMLVIGGEAAGDTISKTYRIQVQAGTSGDGEDTWSESVDLRTIHGCLMFLAWGVFVPIGVTVARFGRSNEWFQFFGLNWFWVHRLMNGTAVILSVVALIIAFLMIGTAHLLAAPHAHIGIVVVFLGVIQPVNAFFRPEPPENKTPWRVRWEMLHKYVGRAAMILGLLNPFWGLVYLRGPSHAPPLALALYSTWVGGLVFFWAYNTIRQRPGTETGATYTGDQSWAKTGLCPCLDSKTSDAVSSMEES